MATKYFIRDTRQVVGNCALWWRPNGAGYTTQLEEAGEYEEDEALATERSSGGTHRAIPCDVVRRASVTHVRVERLGREVEAWKRAAGAPRDATPEPADNDPPMTLAEWAMFGPRPEPT